MGLVPGSGHLFLLPEDLPQGDGISVSTFGTGVTGISPVTNLDSACGSTMVGDIEWSNGSQQPGRSETLTISSRELVGPDESVSSSPAISVAGGIQMDADCYLAELEKLVLEGSTQSPVPRRRTYPVQPHQDRHSMGVHGRHFRSIANARKNMMRVEKSLSFETIGSSSRSDGIPGEREPCHSILNERLSASQT